MSIAELGSAGEVVADAGVAVACSLEIDPRDSTVVRLEIQSQGNTQVKGHNVGPVGLTLRSEATPSVVANGVSLFLANQLVMTGSSTVDGQFSAAKLTPLPTASLTYNQQTGAFEGMASLVDSQNNLRASLRLSGSAVNRVPRAVITAAERVECENGGAVVTLSATQTVDPDGELPTAVLWYDGARPIGQGFTISPRLDLGTHQIRVHVFDAVGFGSATKTVTVEDTLPPSIGSVAYCLWPPNHKMHLVEAPRAIDRCDSNPTVTFETGTSSQPANGIGDGNTGVDLIVGASAACVRSERSGTIKDPREYRLRARAADHNGNVSRGDVIVYVDHDRSAGACLTTLQPIDSDEACVNVVNSVRSPLQQPEPALNSCQAVPGDVGSWIFLVLSCAAYRRRFGRCSQ